MLQECKIITRVFKYMSPSRSCFFILLSRGRGGGCSDFHLLLENSGWGGGGKGV